MNGIIINAKNIKLTPPLEVLKIIKDWPMEIKVEVSRPSKHHAKGYVFYAEANLKIGRTLLRAEAYHIDIRSAIVDVRNELKIQIKKFKEKRSDSERQPKK